MRVPLMLALLILTTLSCRSQRAVHGAGPAARAGAAFVADSLFDHVHLGVSVYDPEKGEYLFRHQSDKYFTPASNTKLLSCYLAMKYLGDSIPALEWRDAGDAIIIRPTGDPTFLHPDYPLQPAADLIRSWSKPVRIDTTAWKETALGPGWAWDDYNDDYSVERSAFPIYGDFIRWHQVRAKKENPQYATDTVDTFVYSDPDLDWPVEMAPPAAHGKFSVRRDLHSNRFTVIEGNEREATLDVPFLTDGVRTAVELLKDTLHRQMGINKGAASGPFQLLRSRPVDSMLRPMMYRSDNFFAEQSLLMVGYRLTGTFNNDSTIGYLLANDLRDMPQQPVWVDGSGLSRYNLFTPDDMVWILDRMRKEQPWSRITGVLATGGQGTLGREFEGDSTRIYAKTGSLSGVGALSGYLLTRSGKTLLFSVMFNNQRGPKAPIRHRVHAFLKELMDK